MAPAHTIFNPADLALTDAVFNSDDALKARVGADGQNLFARQLGRSAPLPTIARPVFDSVGLVALCRIPAKIADMVIPRVSIIVTALKSAWATPDKGFQHQRVRLNNFELVAAPKAQKWAPIIFVRGGELDPPRLNSANTPTIGNLVEVFEAKYGKPVFHIKAHTAHMGNCQ